jgi:hypothetical protein
MKKIISTYLIAALLIPCLSYGATVTKGYIGEQDIRKYDGTGSNTFTRPTSTGGTVTLNKVGYEVDVLVSYGGGASYTDATISAALSAMGTTNKATLLLRPGTWVISNNITITSNITLKVPPGAIIQVATGKTLTINGPFDAGLFQVFSCTGTGTVAGLKQARPEWFGAVINDTGTDNAPAILAAMKAVNQAPLPNSGVVLLTAGYYYVASEIKPTFTIYDMVFRGEGGVRIIYNGAAAPTKAVFRADVSTSAHFARNTFENIFFDAGHLAGFAFVLGAADPETGNASQNVFNKCNFYHGTIAGLLIGSNLETPDHDSACSFNTFNSCNFGDSPYNVKINAVDAYENTFNQCGFVSSSTYTIQHIRVLYGGMTRLNDPEFGPLLHSAAGHPNGDTIGSGNPETGGAAADTVYCVYTESPLSIRNAYSEEGRLILGGAISHSYTEFVSIDGVYMNDPRDTATLSESYFVNMPNGRISLKNATGKSGSTGARPINVILDQGFVENVVLGNYAKIVLSHPSNSVVDGIIPGGYQSLIVPYNWNMQHWTTSAIPAGWGTTLGTGGTATFAQSTDNNVYGDYTCLVTVSGSSSNWLVGLTTYIAVGPSTRPMTVIVTGTTDGTAANAPYVRLNNVSKTNTRIINADNTFILYAEIDATAATTGFLALDIGMAANLTGAFYIDTITAIPGIHGSGSATALVPALSINPPIDMIKTLANSATPSVFMGKVFLTGGTTTITAFTEGVVGQVITILAEHTITITDGTTIFLNGSANFTMNTTDTLTLIRKQDGKWYELGRSDN